MTVRELHARIDSSEFAEWMAFYRIEPWGEERADYRSAMIAQVMANIFRGKNSRPHKVEDFLLFREPKQQTWQQQKDVLMRGFGLK